MTLICFERAELGGPSLQYPNAFHVDIIFFSSLSSSSLTLLICGLSLFACGLGVGSKWSSFQPTRPARSARRAGAVVVMYAFPVILSLRLRQGVA